MTDLNLLPQKNVLSRREKQIRTLLTIAAILFGLFSFGGSGAVIVADQYYSRQIQVLQSDHDRIMSNLSEFSKIAMDVAVIHQKVKAIKAVKSSQIDLAGRITKVIQLFPPDVTIESLGTNNDNGLNLKVSTSNINSLYQLLASLGQGKGSKLLNSISLSGLSVGPSGLFNLAISASFK